MDLLNVYNTERQKTAVLQNAYNITEEQELNNIYRLKFSLPADDPKVDFCQAFHYVRYGETNANLYRIISLDHDDTETPTVTVNCEHVIATLCDNVMFGSYIYNGSLDGTDGTTRDAINWVLEHQTVRNWTLGECDFDYLYEYNWEQENLLNALYSIPKELTAPYQWTFDTLSYPWRLSLKKIDTTVKPEYYIRAGINLLDSHTSKDFTDICTRLYPLGYGEGINQLTIREENDDVPYLEAPPDIIRKYGRKEKVLVDRSFENAESLKAYAERILENLQTPGTSRSFNVVDLYPITTKAIDHAAVGKVCRLTEDNSTVYITKTTRMLDQEGNLQIELSDKATDIVTTIADLADRVRIESVYAQGATQIYQHSKDANAGITVDKGHVISLYFPSEMKQINKVLLRLKLKKFRMYNQTTASGGGVGQTSTSTGTSNISSSGTIGTSWEWDYPQINTSTPVIPGGDFYSHYHYHDYIQLAHSHQLSLAVSDSGHTHSFSVPEHSHGITPGIFENSASPSSFWLYVSGQLKTTVSGTNYNADITEYLLNAQGQIPRNSWIDVTIVPNTLAYVVSSVFLQGFVQSRGGGNY